MTNIDSGFLLFSNDFLDKIESVIEQNRFEINDNEVRDVTNSIISYLNEIRGKSNLYKETIKAHYKYFQEEIRGVKFSDSNQLFRSLGYDPFVYDAIRDKDLSGLGEDKLFLASVNSFLELVPEMFEDKEVQELVNNKIDEIGRNNKFYQRDMKRLVKDTINHTNRILKGE